MALSDEPDWTVDTFAPDANYPAGSLPWSGTPTKVAWSGAPSVGFTPRTAVPAQCINYHLNQFAVALTDIKVRLTSLATRVSTPTTILFTEAGPTEWTCPDDCYRVRLRGCGGGGGGAGGMYGEDLANIAACGGAGGGGAAECTAEVDVVPGTAYEILCGAGGAGGTGGVYSTSTLPQPGSDGGDTIFREKVSGTVLATFKGAQGGRQGLQATDVSGVPRIYTVVPGGSPVAMSRLSTIVTWPRSTLCTAPQFGGDGRHRNHPEDNSGSPVAHGAGSPQGYAGGQQGDAGAHSGFFIGGAGGGGGGAGPYGDGFDGLAGGDAAQSGAGQSAASGGGGGNTGAGGGGGGAGGAGGVGGGGDGSNGIGGCGGRLYLTLVFG